MPETIGKYRLLAPIASGGMADVYRAELPGPGGFVKEVALKVVRGGGDPAAVAMFQQEARLASRLGHANVVQVLDFGREGDRWFIAMELVRGQSLRAVVERCRAEGVRFGLPRAVQVGVEVARALAYAHGLREEGRAAGLVHRDVSPHNVLLSFQGEVKLADFGIARATSAAELTAPGTLKGKLAYMAPEQARAEPVDGRADVFALGVVLWELCAGRRLFARDTDAATLAAVTGAEPVSRPSEWNEEVPPALDEAILAALARDPAQRTASAERLERQLADVRHAQGWRPEDLDLRPLMRRLWPDGSGEAPASGAPASRPAPGRAAPERTAVMPAARVETGSPAPTPAEAPTVTLARPGRGRAALAVGAALLVASAAAGGWRALRAPARPATATGAGASRPASPASAPVAPAQPAPAPRASAQPVAVPPAAAPPARTRPAAASADPSARPGATAASRLAAGQRSAPAAEGDEGEGSAIAGGDAGAEASGAGQPPSAHPPSSAAATLKVNAWPWATVHVDGQPMGDTPKELKLPPGKHKVELTHPRLQPVSREFELAPGARRAWSASLLR